MPGVTGTITYPQGVRVPQKTVAMIGVKNDNLYLAASVDPTWIAAP